MAVLPPKQPSLPSRGQRPVVYNLPFPESSEDAAAISGRIDEGLKVSPSFQVDTLLPEPSLMLVVGGIRYAERS